ncbi:MAG: hypothetical protein HQ518_05165 [Rhodopirellula sp.]|nr:hypothetical protein [Rhodopirellula sp.]
MSDGNGKHEFGFEGDSTGTLEPVGFSGNSNLLDQLARKLNAAPVQAEPVDFARMQQLETRLADREQLVSILTNRLEQAADELDRIKRSGGVLSGTGADSAETAALLAGHSEVATKLDRFVSAWEERYEGPALRRMEASIEELREQLEQATLHGQVPANNAHASRFALDDNEVGQFSGEHDGSPLGRSQLAASDIDQHALSVRRPLDAPVRLVLISSDDVPDDLHVPLPCPFDELEATEPELRKAVNDRDAYIRWLCQQMRQITGRLEGWLGELQTESNDTDLHKRVDEIEQLIHDQLRVAEIEVSIERARLSRDQSRLKEQTEQLARERDQFAKALTPTGDAEETPLLRRWKKFISNQES